MCGSAWGRSRSASGGRRPSSATRSTRRCSGSRAGRPSSCTVCRRIAGRRSRTRSWTGPGASSWTRRRTGCTPRRASSCASWETDRGAMNTPVKRVVLAYSGGLDTSVILRWLIETYRCEVVAYCADLGQGEELLTVRDKALKTGAARACVEDLREEFVRDFVFPMLRANAVYEGGYLLGTSIARPLIAKRQVEIAAAENADAVAHGCTGKGNDQVRFELTYKAFNPKLRVI